MEKLVARYVQQLVLIVAKIRVKISVIVGVLPVVHKGVRILAKHHVRLAA